MRKICNSKGFADIMWVSLMILLMMIFMVGASAAATIFAQYSRALVSTNQGYYDAEAGVYRAQWYIEHSGNGVTVPSTINTAASFSFDANSDNVNDTTVTITCTATSTYSIVSTSNTYNRTITAIYSGGAITSLT